MELVNKDTGLSGVFCPSCDKRLGASDSNPQLVKCQHTNTGGGLQQGAEMIVRCPICGARYNYGQLLALKPRMVKLKITERQPVGTIPLTIWVYPEPLEAMRQKFSANFQATMTAMFTAIADPDTVMIEGEHGRALKKAGVMRGRDVEGLAAYVKQLEQDIEEAKVREKVLAPFLGMLQALQPQAAGREGQSQLQLQPQPQPATHPFVMPGQVTSASGPQPNISPDHYAADYIEEVDPLDPLRSGSQPPQPPQPLQPPLAPPARSVTRHRAAADAAAAFGKTLLGGVPKPTASGQ